MGNYFFGRFEDGLVSDNDCSSSDTTESSTAESVDVYKPPPSTGKQISELRPTLMNEALSEASFSAARLYTTGQDNVTASKHHETPAKQNTKKPNETTEPGSPRSDIGCSDATLSKAWHRSPHSPRKISQTKKYGQTRSHALTVDNILKGLKEVNWETLCGKTRTVFGGGVLHLHHSRWKQIEMQYTTDDDCKKAAVQFWIRSHPYASWRLLITKLYWEEEHSVAQHLHRYAEKLTDPTLTHENVSKVTAKVGKNILADVLAVPKCKREEFQKFSFTALEYRNKLIDYFIKYSYFTSWSDLSSRLFEEKQYEAVSAAKKFIKKTSEPTLILHNLTTLLRNIHHDWRWFAILLNIPEAKRMKIEQMHFDDNQCSRACYNLYITEHPHPSWKEIAFALYLGGHFDEMEIVQKKYLKGTAENRRHFEEAMKHGRIKLWLSKLLMYGAAGSGKTSTMEWILGNPPPADRTSTPLAMRPTSICRVNCDGDDFTKIGTLQDRKVFLARALHPAKPEQTKQDTSTAIDSTPTDAASQLKSVDDESSGEVKPPLDDQPPSGVKEQPDADDVLSDEEIESKVDVILESISIDDELVKLMDHISTNVHPLVCLRLIQMIDCGGQSQFHEVLPIFLHKLSFYIFVFRLCDELAKHPVVEIFADGKQFGSSYISPQSVQQLLQHCVRGIHSRTLSTAGNPDLSHQKSSTNDVEPSFKANDPNLSKIMIVGTHLDKAKKSTESLDEKNIKMLNILSPLAKEQVIYHNLSKGKVIIPINAKAPGKSEDELVKQVRKILLSDLSAEPAEIPSKWFALEILLEQMTEVLERGVLSKNECVTAAVDKLHFEEDAVESALRYLNQLSVLFYYPEILPNVVFAKPQVIIDKISELVFKSAEIEKLSEERVLSGEWKEFHEWALVTTKFLSNEFSSHYFPGLFGVTDLKKLFLKLLVFSAFSETHVFVPSLLRHLDDKEVNDHRSSTIPSLVLQFADGAPRQGIFCNLICWLASSDNDYPHPWSITKVDNDKPKCLYRNCVQFDFPNSAAIVTLIDTYSHFEVHIDIPPHRIENLCPKILPKVHTAVFNGIQKAAVNTGNFDYPRPTPALICPCGKSNTHIATADPEFGWTCSLDRKIGGDLTPHQLLWIVAPTKPKCLNESHFCELYIKLKEHASKWRDIGTFLQFQQGELNNIQSRPLLLQSAPESWLGAMLTDWLHRGPSDDRGRPSIENLKLALQKSGLGALSFDIK